MAQILLVDDDAGILAVLTGLFEDEGWDVLTAHESREALAVLEITRPAVMLLDLMMPGMSGQELLSEMAARGLDVPVVLMSARKNVGDIAAATQAAGYLTKPFDIDEALQLVANVSGDRSEHAVG